MNVKLRREIASRVRDWIHDQPWSICDPFSDTCPDWEKAYEITDAMLSIVIPAELSGKLTAQAQAEDCVVIRLPKDTPVQLAAMLKSFENIAADEPVADQLGIFLQSLEQYATKNKLYKDNWRRFGWRGCLFRLRERTERAWDALWDAPESEPPLEVIDDLIDLCNFAAFTIKAIKEGNRDGSWF